MFQRKLGQLRWFLPGTSLLVIGLGQPASALAAEMRSGNDITVSSNETIDDDLYAFGTNVVILGRVTGSVIAGGNNVTVSGEVGGDVMAAGSSVIVNGPVRGSVRAAGQSVQVANSVERDVMAAGNSVALVGNGRVGRDLLGAGATVTIAGPVGRNVNASGRDVVLSNAVGGQVQSDASNLRLDPSARVQGAVAYTSANQADVAPGATVGGPVTRSEPAKSDKTPAGVGILDWLRGIVGLSLFGIVLLLVFPRAAQQTSQLLHRSAWRSLGLGSLMLIVTPVAIVAVVGVGFLVGGWWLGGPLLGGYVLWLVLGYLVSSLTLGREVLERIRRPRTHAALGFLVGMTILAVLQLVPLVGGLIGLAAVVFGSGSLLLALQTARSPRPSTVSNAVSAPLPLAPTALPA